MDSANTEPSCVPGTALSIEDNAMDRSGSCLPGVVSLASCMSKKKERKITMQGDECFDEATKSEAVETKF